MNTKDIAVAKAEAERFLSVVGELNRKTALLEADYKKRKAAAADDRYVFCDTANVEHAAVRRSSMDLTRALARMRNPR